MDTLDAQKARRRAWVRDVSDYQYGADAEDMSSTWGITRSAACRRLQKLAKAKLIGPTSHYSGEAGRPRVIYGVTRKGAALIASDS